MAKSRIVTQTATLAMPYHFTCNYCGKRNDQAVDISGAATRVLRAYRPDTSGTLGLEARQDLGKSIGAVGDMIGNYGAGIRAGRRFRDVWSGEYAGLQYDCLLPFHNVVCAHCGKKQAWSIDPSDKKSHRGWLTFAAGLILSVIFFAVATILSGSAAADVIGVFGFVILIAGIVLAVVFSRLGKRKLREALAAEPNDPDKLPVLDPQALEDSDAASDGDRLSAPAVITLIRDSSFVYNAVKPTFRLNVRDVGSLANGESLTAKTMRRHNVLYASDNSYGNSFAPLAFEVEPGAEAEIHFKATKFVPGACRGIRVIE